MVGELPVGGQVRAVSVVNFFYTLRRTIKKEFYFRRVGEDAYVN